jgi:putative aminopeptidase FrvX
MPTRRLGVQRPRLALLRRLCEAVAVSGDEAEVRNIVLDALKPAALDHSVDATGNLLVARHGRGRRRLRLVLDAHMDEVGFMLVADDGDGIYQLQPVGGIDVRGMMGKHVVVGRKHVPGVIGARPEHLSKPEELKRPAEIETLRVDLGPGAKAKVGERGTFAPNFRRVGPSIMSKSLDNRLGVATLVELMRAAPRNLELLAAFTVQEEIGFRGAEVAARYFRPDLAIVIDATPANDLPMQREGDNTLYNTKLGLGPAIYVADGSTIADKRLVQFLADTARREKLPFQFRQPGGGGTNAGVIQRANQGVPVVSVSVPHRYTHTAMSISRIDDWYNTYRLLLAAIASLTPGFLRAVP